MTIYAQQEKYDAAWEILQNGALIKQMFFHVGANADDVNNALRRFRRAKKEYSHCRMEEKIHRFIIMLDTTGLSREVVLSYLVQNKEVRLKQMKHKRKEITSGIAMAVIDGKCIYTQGEMPQWAELMGFEDRDDIPEEYYTNEYKEFLRMQMAHYSQIANHFEHSASTDYQKENKE